ncbi:hypothetical protein HOU03_gp338 [Caulobacter phage CcrSC]|uniref:Uncharacterized protein n=1 Tax=Caulobacter phage CcrSC TaxID=2283272 RepID=A0A385EE50_9CAUD|nr:hypothetical protein HOU03_gp338 [Caulobacter phage CcrSC]AXQ69930.1 hypothetical protein CcrSC_gp348 [Caulobacter phage CcrSC]
MASKLPATKAGRAAFSIIQGALEPLGFGIEFETNSKHNFVVASRRGRRWTFGISKGGNARADHYTNYARKFARRVLAEAAAT